MPILFMLKLVFDSIYRKSYGYKVEPFLSSTGLYALP